MHRWLLSASFAGPGAAGIGDRNSKLESHGASAWILSQGFVNTDQNNWLTMNTREGSGAMTDMG